MRAACIAFAIAATFFLFGFEESKAEEEDEKKPAARNGFSFWRKREAGACAPVRGLRSRSETHVTGASA
jgi:hypothetical protein